MKGVAAVIVTYNSAGHIGRCLDSLPAHVEAVVVDNASSDNSASEANRRPAARVIVNRENVGFAAAVNQGARATEAPLLLILNPDTELLRGFDELATMAGRHGVAAGRLLGEDGRVQAGFTIRRFPTPAALAFESLGVNRAWPSNPVNRRYRCLDSDLNAEGWAEQPAGAFLVVRRDIFERLGGFDEAFYPVWFEDVDFLKRAADMGYSAWYFPRAEARHCGAHSVGRISGEYRKLFWYVSLLRYAAKHFRSLGFRAVCSAVAVGRVMAVAAGIFGKRDYIEVDLRVLRMAVSSLLAGELRPPGAYALGVQTPEIAGQAVSPGGR